jgi:hypothetical protein
MTTTFKSVETINDAIVALFVADDSWQEVYDYVPSPTEMGDKTPILIVRVRGILQTSEGTFTNPTSIRFLATSMVLATDTASGWTSANAESKFRELNRTARQIIRDNMAGAGVCDGLTFGGRSQVDDAIIGGRAYIVETHEFFANLRNGA